MPFCKYNNLCVDGSCSPCKSWRNTQAALDAFLDKERRHCMAETPSAAQEQFTSARLEYLKYRSECNYVKAQYAQFCKCSGRHIRCSYCLAAAKHLAALQARYKAQEAGEKFYGQIPELCACRYTNIDCNFCKINGSTDSQAIVASAAPVPVVLPVAAPAPAMVSEAAQMSGEALIGTAAETLPAASFAEQRDELLSLGRRINNLRVALAQNRARRRREAEHAAAEASKIVHCTLLNQTVGPLHVSQRHMHQVSCDEHVIEVDM